MDKPKEEGGRKIHTPLVTEHFLSLERILVSKNKNLLKWIPRPLMSCFKRLICLDKINYCIYHYQDKKGVAFATAVLENEFKVKVEVVNPENIPTEGRFFVIANHPLGGADGLALISEIGKKRTDVLFPVNDILCTIPSLQPLFIPVNKYGDNTENHDILSEAFASDSCILFFPAGMVSRQFKGGEIRDLKWKNTLVKKGVQYQRDIVPVFIEAHNTKFFYRFAQIRKALGIKQNIELVLLPGEMFKQKGKTIRLIFGSPIPYTTFDHSLPAQKWTNKVRQYVYSLKQDPTATFSK